MRPEAHFYRSNGLNGLACAYTHTVQWHALRTALARARERTALTLDQAAEQSGTNRATIHSIENVKREPTLKPELETIESLASTYGLTLSALFADIERSQNSALLGDAADAQNVPPSSSTRGQHHGRTVSSDTANIVGNEVLILALNDTIERCTNRLVDRLEQLANTRAPKSRPRSSPDRRRKKAS